MPSARCRFAKYLRVGVNGRSNGHDLPVATLVQAHPARREETEHGERVRGVLVRLQLERPGVKCDIQLDDRSLFFPSDAALASWTAQASPLKAELVYD